MQIMVEIQMHLKIISLKVTQASTLIKYTVYEEMAFSPLRPWRHRHIAHKTISYRLRGPQPGDLFLLPPQPQGGTSKPQCPHGRVGPRPTPRGRSERRRPWPELPPTLLSVVRPRPCAARPMPPLSSRRRFVYSGAIQCPKASITFRTLL